MKSIGFIGAGNMGGALISAIAKAGYGKQLNICDKNTARVKELCDTYGANATDINGAASCDVVFLAIKPQLLLEIGKELEGFRFNENQLIISMLAGVKIDKIASIFDTKIIRIMPNTPVGVGEGMILYTCNAKVKKEDEETFLEILKASGKLDKLDEKLIDAGCAVSGCGPAYVYMFIDAIADGAVRAGLSREKAIKYAVQTLIGASKMVLETGKHPDKLKDEVCSPAGATIEGVAALEDGAFRAVVAEAVIAAYERTTQLGG